MFMMRLASCCVLYWYVENEEKFCCYAIKDERVSDSKEIELEAEWIGLPVDIICNVNVMYVFNS
jgi:hypothetical protein